MNFYYILFAIILTFQTLLELSAQNITNCFSPLDKLPKKEIQNIFFMNFKDTAIKNPASQILNCYLKESHAGEKTVIAQYFDIYKKCQDYRNRFHFEPFGYHQLDELITLGLPYNLEKFLYVQIASRNRDDIKDGVIFVQSVIAKDIELSKDYMEYKHVICMKS